jgi:hypothetical protein
MVAPLSGDIDPWLAVRAALNITVLVTDEDERRELLEMCGISEFERAADLLRQAIEEVRALS